MFLIRRTGRGAPTKAYKATAVERRPLQGAASFYRRSSACLTGLGALLNAAMSCSNRGARAEKASQTSLPCGPSAKASAAARGNQQQMSDLPVESADNGDVASVMDSLHKKGLVRPQAATSAAAAVTQMVANATSASTSSSSSSSRVAKTCSTSTSSSSTSSSSSRVHHVTSSSTSSSSSSSSEMKASSMKSDLSELKSSISEMKNISSSAANFSCRQLHTCGSLEELDEQPGPADEPVVTFPPEPDSPSPPSPSPPPPPPPAAAAVAAVAAVAADTLQLEQRRVLSASASSTRTLVDGATATAELTFQQQQQQQHQQAAAALRARLDADGLSGDRSLALKQKAMAAQQQRHTVSSAGGRHQPGEARVLLLAVQHHHHNQGVCTKSVVASASQMSQLVNGHLRSAEDELLSETFQDLDQLSANSNPKEVEKVIVKYSQCLERLVQSLERGGGGGGGAAARVPQALDRVNELVRRAWSVPRHGHELGYSLCNALRVCGALDMLVRNCSSDDGELQFSSARLLEQCLTTENRAHVVECGLEKVVKVACVCIRNSRGSTVDHSRVGTGILEHLFKHSEGTCSDVIRLGGLDAVLFECRKNDVETLRNCAGALANLSLYGGAENQEAMIKRKVPMWLFPLAFHNDDNIKYYACLAIAVLVANKEIEAAVLKSGTLDLVEPFVTTHNPFEFAKSNHAHAHGQSKNWLQRLVPVLSSKREEARNLAAFHFCMEAGIKKQQGNTELFREIGAIEPLKVVASCPNAVASKYAAQALRLIGEEVPHKLSQQVPLWSTEDVREWVKQIGFAEYANNFTESRVDGDLLLQLTEENLRDDIGIANGIRRRRFTRELQNLKKMADYSSRDAGNLNTFLQTIGPEFSIYTYSMLNAGVDKDSIRSLSEEQLANECGITNSIHRLRILNSIREMETGLGSSYDESPDKSLDVFVSYRRSNGSQLASLLKVHLQLRGFSVFIDVERLEAGKFDNNLLQSIRQAKHFLLVLTPKALDRCIGDTDCKDWVHKEVVAALQSQCNIIPIIDNFSWPDAEELPEDMRAVCHFNGVRWIHDYQDACVDKLERFLRGEMSVRAEGPGSVSRIGLAGKGDATPGGSSGAATPLPLGGGRQPPYQRMHSNDSGKGSASDKDNGGPRD
ncbi:NAD(+) hydrolase sarm1 isoform X2 [Schistocerca cancellata]|uniref:NAD(+) hydrolase sarm1 isoform X2 n=1 Tax=Schistocerca cancellata TaxID=274614 RepID=UPI002117BB6C|nr:NAD(+) hydrolase sarm1 isoform X2 [Schistocerca cancellata]